MFKNLKAKFKNRKCKNGSCKEHPVVKTEFEPKNEKKKN